MEALRAALIAGGAISASDCMKLVPFSRDDPAAQVAAFKAAHPGLFYDPPPFNARTASKAECDAQLRAMQQQEAKRQMDAATTRTIERMTAEFARADALAEKRRAENAARQEADRQRAEARQQARRGGW